MSELSNLAQRFVEANKKSTIIIGAWLNKNKQDSNSPDEFVYLQYTLKDSQKFCLPAADVKALNAVGFYPRWDL